MAPREPKPPYANRLDALDRYIMSFQRDIADELNIANLENFFHKILERRTLTLDVNENADLSLIMKNIYENQDKPEVVGRNLGELSELLIQHIIKKIDSERLNEAHYTSFFDILAKNLNYPDPLGAPERLTEMLRVTRGIGGGNPHAAAASAPPSPLRTRTDADRIAAGSFWDQYAAIVESYESEGGVPAPAYRRAVRGAGSAAAEMSRTPITEQMGLANSEYEAAAANPQDVAHDGGGVAMGEVLFGDFRPGEIGGLRRVGAEAAVAVGYGLDAHAEPDEDGAQGYQEGPQANNSEDEEGTELMDPPPGNSPSNPEGNSRDRGAGGGSFTAV